jgi:hypothetical protein
LTSHLDVARKYLRMGVREDPFGSNWGYWVGAFLRRVGLGPNPWCMAFIYTLDLEATGGKFVPRTGLVSAFWNYAIPRHWANRGTKGIRSGDFICFEWDTSLGWGDILDHIGIVSAVTGGQIHTIEGNSGDRVATRVYSMGDRRIYGFIRLPVTRPVNPNLPGAPYVTKPFPLPELIKLGANRARVRVGKDVRFQGSLSKAQRFYRDKLAYWKRRNETRR